MFYAVRISLGSLSRRNVKFSQVHLACSSHDQKWKSRNFSLSIHTHGEEKEPSDSKPQRQDDQKESKYRQQHYDNPIHRTFSILAHDVKSYLGLDSTWSRSKVNDNASVSSGSDSMENLTSKKPKLREKDTWPSFCDVLIIGGGLMGSSVAYHLKEQALQGLDVVVVEEDQSYKRASTVLSVGGIRQQFSVAENIQLSLYGADFLRQAHKLLAVEGEDAPSVQFNPHGYLTLASVDGAHQLQQNYELQRELGAKVNFMSAKQLKAKYPWLKTAGVEAGVLGLENEGWFDPWSLLLSLQRKATSLGTQFVEGRVTNLDGEPLDDLVVEGVARSDIKQIRIAEVVLPNGEKRSIKFSLLVVAAGAWSGQVGRMAGVGEGKGLMSVPIPVEPRKRYVYCYHAPDGPGLDAPLVIDPNGTYFRREGLRGLYLCGQSPPKDQEPSIQDLEVDHKFFEEEVWPTLANRVPSFECLKVHSSWAGYYDYNTYDQNAIVGLHPLLTNMYITSGFSGHGIQQAAGVGRAIMESIIFGEYRTINLERFSFDRILIDEPLYEANIV